MSIPSPSRESDSIGLHSHAHPVSVLLSRFQLTLNDGLSPTILAERLERFGVNALAVARARNPLRLLLSQFHNPLIYILLASAAVTALMQDWVDASVIAAVVLINAVVGFLQESNAHKAIHALSQSVAFNAMVIRDGIRQQVLATSLVPGDVVLLQPGDKVPADMRLWQVNELQIDESSLTGESVPTEKTTEPLPLDTALADRSNMAYASTLVTHGTGAGIVVHTGNLTEIGQINRLISQAQALETPLTMRISRFSWMLTWAILVLALLTFVIGWSNGENPLDMFTAAVALAVAAIPEGLPVAVTITLAIGVRRMARRNAIIRKLPAVETLGSTTIICADKTGTLTQNAMTVQQIVVDDVCYQLSGSGYEPTGQIRCGDAPVVLSEAGGLAELLCAGVLCNDARLFQAAGGAWRIEGDPTEAALLVAAEKAGLKTAMLYASHPRLDVIPFDSTHQFMATLHLGAEAAPGVVYVKGSVEAILARCTSECTGAHTAAPLNRERVLRQVATLTGQGLRVLAFARMYWDQRVQSEDLTHQDVQSGLTFLGLQAMIDPPRPEVQHAIALCHDAGIRIKMITGDHLGTAIAIARQIGLHTAGHGEIQAIEGRLLEGMPDQELRKIVAQVSVFARVAPEQKLRLVMAMQSLGNVVAMTGDGVNDAPALRQANIGIAMGISGTDVSKEAADMVLTDDNFATITAAVEEGRAVYDNLVKFITWTIPTNVGEGLIILLAVLLGLGLPILPVQILWLNMVTAVLLGIPIAFERRERDIMQRAPRALDQPIMTRALLFRTLLVGLLLTVSAFGLFEWSLAQGERIEVARTMAFNMFALGEAFYLFNCRSLNGSVWSVGFFSNPWLLIGFAALVVAQAGIVYLPIMNAWFQTAPLAPDAWLLAVLAGLMINLVVAAEKWLSCRVSHSKHPQL